MFYKKILLYLITCYAVNAHAQQHTEADMEKFLTNGEFRTWVFKSYKVTLGNSCSGDGQSFDFYKKKNLAIWKRCDNGVPRLDTLTWSIRRVSNSPGEYYLVFNKPVNMYNGEVFSQMLLTLPNPAVMKSKTDMKWSKTPTCKLCPGEIIEFKSRN